MPSLADFGTLIGNEFIQSRHKGQSHPNGFCHGVCIDWIRRTLGGGRSSLLDDPKKKRTPDQQAARTASNVQRMKNIYDRIDQKMDQIDAHNKDIISRWQSLPQATRYEWEETKRVHGPWGYVWNSFMKELDADSTKNRKFSDVSHVSGQVAKEYQTVKEFLAVAVKVTEFGKWLDTALMLGPMWKKEGKDNGGHAIVLYRQNTKSIQLFDPNFGCYQVDGKILAALEFLCKEECANWGSFYKGSFDRFAGPRTSQEA